MKLLRQCFHPKTVPNPKYPGEREYISVPCGKCSYCRKRFLNDWTQRIIAESSNPGRHYFLTLTYAEEPADYEKAHIDKFLKTLRNEFRNIKFRYFIVGERGSNFGRIHYHAILWTNSFENLQSHISEAWIHGFSYFGTVTPCSCAYVAKYIVTPNPDESLFRVMSRRPGIGRCKLTDRYIASQLQNPRRYYYDKGFRKGLSRYYTKLLEDNGVIFPRQSYESQLEPYIEYEQVYGREDYFRQLHGLDSVLQERRSEVFRRERESYKPKTLRKR